MWVKYLADTKAAKLALKRAEKLVDSSAKKLAVKMVARKELQLVV